MMINSGIISMFYMVITSVVDNFYFIVTGEPFLDDKTCLDLHEAIFRRHSSSVVLQGFCRIIMSKREANVLRMQPDNLFHPEYTSRRKKILMIDSTRFSL